MPSAVHECVCIPCARLAFLAVFATAGSSQRLAPPRQTPQSERHLAMECRQRSTVWARSPGWPLLHQDGQGSSRKMNGMSRDAGCRHPSIGKTGFPDLLDRMALASSRCACFVRLADTALIGQTSSDMLLKTDASSVKPTLPTSFQQGHPGMTAAGRVLKCVMFENQK